MKARQLLLTLLALLASITTSAYEWTDENGTTWSFDLLGGEARLYNSGKISIGGNIPTSLIVPSVVYEGDNSYPVTVIGYSAFYNCNDIVSVTLPSGITIIQDGAFSYCYELSSINLPEGVTTIGNSAFSNCFNLSSLLIPGTVESIGNYAFNCTRMKITFTSATPPSSLGGLLSGDLHIVVPTDGVEAYREALPSLLSVICDASHAEKVVDRRVLLPWRKPLVKICSRTW